MARQLNDWISNYLKYTDNSEPPFSYREWVAVSVVAAALQRKVSLPFGSLTFYPNMYIVLVGPAGKCRKGTAMNAGAYFLKKLGVKLAAEAITREALIRSLNSASSNLTNIETGEIEMHASLTIFSQELTVFLGYNNLQLISDLVDWYDCRDRWKYETKNKGTDDILGVWVNIIGATTPDLIKTALPRDAVGGGLASRTIFIYEENKGKIVPFPFFSKEELELREALENDLEHISMLSGPFRFTEDFVDGYGDWYLDQERNSPFQGDPNFAGYVERRPTHILKLSLILSASRDDSRIIDKTCLDRAIGMLTRVEKKMPRVFAGYGSSSNADITSKIMKHIALKKVVTKEELVATHYADLQYGVQTLDTILQVLKGMNFCSVVHSGNKTEIHFNPNSLKGKSFT